ncbi:MAG: M48 family metallopeptidase [Bdellovibrionales bacterium]|jgi:predicted Zn-dependent protease|nr:M48 family metallopeptidase [Bdellovibrionales bacterium]MBT3525270.1 M48 family metallopeptidase [Bdellovibrionales bacterium]MBT7668268.1 M48 family metallopeptidase [Bdellovibrionales bacterium]MBT7767439.1 M48 family metallopeptidase [Bdellovibrionales bacterium]
MKYQERKLEHELNVSSSNLLHDFMLYMVGGIAVLAIVFYLATSSVNFVIDHLSPELESKLYGIVASTTPTIKADPHPRQKEIEDIFRQLLEQVDIRGQQFKLKIIDASEENAFAFPDGTILLHSAIVDAMESEQEITMILAHELGHYYHKDHLRGMGAGLTLLAFSAAIGVGDSSLKSIVTSILQQIKKKFGREQELAADLYALRILKKKYGSTQGALSLFKRLNSNTTGMARATFYLSTHPHPNDRIKALIQRIEQ